MSAADERRRSYCFREIRKRHREEREKKEEKKKKNPGCQAQTSAETLCAAALAAVTNSQNTSLFAVSCVNYCPHISLFTSRLALSIRIRKQGGGGTARHGPFLFIFSLLSWLFIYLFITAEGNNGMDKKRSGVSCPLPSLSGGGETYDHPITMVTSHYIQTCPGVFLPPAVTRGHSWQGPLCARARARTDADGGGCGGGCSLVNVQKEPRRGQARPARVWWWNWTQ